MSNKTDETIEKALEVHLAEYQALREEFRMFHNARQNILNYVIISMIAMPPIILSLSENNTLNEAIGILLLIMPIFFGAFTLAYIGNVRGEINIARYTYEHLAVEIKQLLNKNELLEWGHYWDNLVAFNNLIGGLGEILVLGLPIVASIIGYFILLDKGIVTWSSVSLLLVILDLIVILLVLLIIRLVFLYK